MGTIDAASQLVVEVDSLTGFDPDTMTKFVTFDPLKLTGTGLEDDLLMFSVSTMLGDKVDESDGMGAIHVGTAKEYDGVPTVDYTGDIVVDIVNPAEDVNGKTEHEADGNGVDPTKFSIAVNNGTLKYEEIVGEGLVFANYIKGSIHGLKFHDIDRDGIRTIRSRCSVVSNSRYSMLVATLYCPTTVSPTWDRLQMLIQPTMPTRLTTTPFMTGSMAVDHTGVAVAGWSSSAADHTTPTDLPNSGSATANLPEKSTASLTAVVHVPFSAGIGFSKMVLGAGDTLDFYIDNTLAATFTDDGTGTFTDAWIDGVTWGTHVFTWTFTTDDDPDDLGGQAWIDDIRFTARTGQAGDVMVLPDGTVVSTHGEFWFEDVSPGDYSVVERLDLIGHYPGEVMPSFMNVEQWAEGAFAWSSQHQTNAEPKDENEAVLALGAPDGLGWSPLEVDDANHTGLEWIEVDFPKAVHVTSVWVDLIPDAVNGHQQGDVVQKIEVYDADAGVWIPMPAVVEDADHESASSSVVGMADFLTSRVRVTIDHDADWGGREVIDAIRLDGMMRLSDRVDVTVESGEELVWQEGAAHLPDPCGPTPDTGDVIFVIDVSGSTQGPFAGTPVGDVNSDGLFDTVLDAELAAFLAVNANLVAVNPTARVSIVVFDSTATALDMGAIDAWANPGAGVAAILQSIDINPFGNTNFEAALDEVIDVLAAVGTPNGTGNVLFMSDGEPNVPSTAFAEFTDEANHIRNILGHSLTAFGVGASSSLPALQAIDPLAMQFTNADELLTFFTGNGGGGGIDCTRREEVDENLIFANEVKGSIHAFKFEDYNANGVYEGSGDLNPNIDGDQHDTPWAGFVFELYRQDIYGEFTVHVGTQVTDENGEVWFLGLKPGEIYELVEVGPNTDSALGAVVEMADGDQIMSSTHDDIRIVVKSGEEWVWRGDAAMLDANSPSVKHEVPIGSGLSFGNYVKGSIHGFKFQDMDGDGVFDPGGVNGDDGFGGITFTVQGIDQHNSTVTGDVVTLEGGEFWFENLIPGRYVVAEDLSVSWPDYVMPSNDDSRIFFVGSREELVWTNGVAHLPQGSARHEVLVGDNPDFDLDGDSLASPGLYYGNVVKGSVHAFKCHDVNADGECDPGHVVIVLDASTSMLGIESIEEIEAGDPAKAEDDIPGDVNGDGVSNSKFDAALLVVQDLIANLPSNLPGYPANAPISLGIVVLSGGVADPVLFGGNNFIDSTKTAEITAALLEAVGR